MLPLRTERLTIRMMRQPDLGPVHAYRADPTIAHFQDWEMPYTKAAAQRSIDRQAELDGPTDGHWVGLAVELTATGEVVGDVAVELRGGGMFATLGYTFAGAHHGKGYATEAAGAVVEALCAASWRRSTRRTCHRCACWRRSGSRSRASPARRS